MIDIMNDSRCRPFVERIQNDCGDRFVNCSIFADYLEEIGEIWASDALRFSAKLGLLFAPILDSSWPKPPKWYAMPNCLTKEEYVLTFYNQKLDGRESSGPITDINYWSSLDIVRGYEKAFKIELNIPNANQLYWIQKLGYYDQNPSLNFRDSYLDFYSFEWIRESKNLQDCISNQFSSLVFCGRGPGPGSILTYSRTYDLYYHAHNLGFRMVYELTDRDIERVVQCSSTL